MNKVAIAFSTGDLSKLISVGSGYYEFTAQFLNSSGLPLNNPNIPNTYTASITPTGSSFVLEVPVVEAPYNIPNVTVKIFTNGNPTCCFATTVVPIVNSGLCTGSLTIEALQCNGIAVLAISGLVEPIVFSVKSSSTGDTELFSSRAGNLIWFNYNPHDVFSATYDIVATAANGCVASASGFMACSTPNFNIEITSGTCTGSVLSNYNAKVTNPVNCLYYKVCYDDNFSPCIDDCESGRGSINQTGETNIPLVPPATVGIRTATIRFFSDNSCARYQDYQVTLQNFGCAACPPDGTWSQNSNGDWYKTLTQDPTATPSGYLIIAKKSEYYAKDGTIIYDPGLVSSTTLTTPGMWKATNAIDGPMNRCSIWTNKNDGDINGGNDLPTGKWLGFGKCLTGLTIGKQYFVGLEADNFYRLIVDGELIFQSSSNATHFRTWKIYPIVAKKTEMLITMEGMNEERVAGFGCQVYDNTKSQIVAATSVGDLNIIFDSISKVGGFFDNGGVSGGIQYGYGCPDGYQYNPCTGDCEKTMYCEEP